MEGKSVNSLAASVGVGSLSKLGSSDAINVIIYPNILKSKDFIAELMNDQHKIPQNL